MANASGSGLLDLRSNLFFTGVGLWTIARKWNADLSTQQKPPYIVCENVVMTDDYKRCFSTALMCNNLCKEVPLMPIDSKWVSPCRRKRNFWSTIPMMNHIATFNYEIGGNFRGTDGDLLYVETKEQISAKCPLICLFLLYHCIHRPLTLGYFDACFIQILGRVLSCLRS
jgi:hypothetical protein